MISKQIEIHNILTVKFKNKYGTDKLKIVGNQTYVLYCEKHGYFEASYLEIKRHDELCKKCKLENSNRKAKFSQRSNTFDELIEKFNLKNNNKYDYSLCKDEDYISQHASMQIICEKHGIFAKKIVSHLTGYGCQFCEIDKIEKYRSEKTISVVEKLRKVHGDAYDYSKVNFKATNIPVKLICKKHGEIKVRWHKHLNGTPCSECRDEKSVKNLDYILERFKKVHGDRYDYTKVKEQPNIKKKVIITCRKHGDFLQSIGYHFAGQNCKKCAVSENSVVSAEETVFYEWFKQLDNDALQSDKELIYPFEVDILSHKYKLGIEYNGLHWHSNLSEKLDNNHIDKTISVRNAGYNLFHIYADDIRFNKSIVESMLRHRTLQSLKISARKTKFVEILEDQAKEFFINTNLEGFIPATIYYGLMYENEIVAVMSFSQQMIVQFSTKLNLAIVGGFSKLVSNYSKLHKIDNMSILSSNDFSTNESLKYFQISNIDEIQPRPYYITNKRNLISVDEVHQYVQDYYRILWDSGSIRFKLDLSYNKLFN